mmetsp:Transcript_70565/g.132033  ORF Transcript_70565/g.132033 Transcript_70565/m.132033 type:complete len:382 (+) Transcript_70565:22-1167(+)
MARYVVTLAKPFGMGLDDRGGAEGVCVDSLVLGGPAQQCGSIKVGDRLITVASQDVSKLDLDAILACIARAPSPVKLVFMSQKAATVATPAQATKPALAAGHARAPPTQWSAPTVQPATQAPATAATGVQRPWQPSLEALNIPAALPGFMFEVSLQKPLGIELESAGEEYGEDGIDAGAYVLQLVPGGSAQRSGQVKVGDVVMTVNGESVSQLPFDSVMAKIAAATSVVTLQFARPNPPVDDSESCDRPGLLSFLDSMMQSGVKVVEATHVVNKWWINNLTLPIKHHGLVLKTTKDPYLRIHLTRRGLAWKVTYGKPSLPATVCYTKRHETHQTSAGVGAFRKYCAETQPWSWPGNDCKQWVIGALEVLGVSEQRVPLLPF